jgi:hypothetical protein
MPSAEEVCPVQASIWQFMIVYAIYVNVYFGWRSHGIRNQKFFSIFFEAGDLTRRNVGTMLISAAPPEKQELKLAKTMVESSRLVPGVDRTTPRSF